MKDVAMLINEQKRRIENMGKIGCWQKTIEGWKVRNYINELLGLDKFGRLTMPQDCKSLSVV